MGVDVSQIENNSENEQFESDESIDLKKEFCIQYRLLRKKLSSFLREKFKKHFINILYITLQTPPEDFITGFQKQYPDKNVKVLIPLFEESKHWEKTSIKIDYFMQNQTHSACVYKIPAGYENIQIYGIYTDVFSSVEKDSEIYDIKYLSHFSKIARKVALKLKPDIIHADNVPLLMGLELDGRWLSGYPIKYIQQLHDYTVFKEVEPFWAAINLANKAEMKKICNDNVIKSSVAAIFNIESTKKIKKLKAYINYIFTKYDEYRQKVNIGEDTRENVLLGRMNERILKMFPKMGGKNQKSYNPAYLSMKQAALRGINTDSGVKPAWARTLQDVTTLPIKGKTQMEGKIHHSFDIENFRETRYLNKRYLVRELSEKRIEMKFYDIGLFEEDANIRGFLDSFFKAPLFFCRFNEFTDLEDIKTVSLAVLKAFELRKNIQVVFNYPKGLHCSYLSSLFDFMESQSALSGKWISIEGSVNMPQFLSSSDMILIPSANGLDTEDLLYNALGYGCIPVLSENCFNNTVSDIFDDMNEGCVFRNGADTDAVDGYDAVFMKALEFYTTNSAGMNIVIKNAMNYDCGWDFEALEKYNNIYEELI